VIQDAATDAHDATVDARRTTAKQPGVGPGLAASAVGVVLVAFTLRQAVSSVPPVLGDLGLTPDRAALLVTIPVLCFSIGALAGPALRARLGEERTIFAAEAVLFAGLVVRALWPTWGLFPGTILAGLAIAVLNVLLPSLVKRRFAGRIGTMMAAYTTAMAVGAALAAGFTVPVLRAANGSVSVALGVWALPAVLALVAWLPQIGASAIVPAAHLAGSRRAMWRYPLAWCVLLYMGMQSLLFYGPLSWLPEIYRQRGVDPAQAGFLLLIFNVLGIVGNLTAPVLASRMRDQRPAIAVTIMLTTVGLLGVLLAPTSTALIWSSLMGVAQGASLSLALLVIVLRSADSETAALLSGMAQSGGYLVAASGPLIMGLLQSATGNWSVPLLFLIGVAVVIWIPAMIAGRNVVIGGDRG
jgi:CP family cyanate transporter-like MFS transporter